MRIQKCSFQRAGSASLLLAACILLLPAIVPAGLAAQDDAIGVGAHAPPLELADVAGVARRISWADGGPAATILYFFDPQSPDCLLQLNFLDALHSRGRDFGLAVYAVEAKGRQPAEVERSLERYCALYRAPGFPLLPDPSFRAGRLYGVQQVPTTFITESHGVVLNRIQGYTTAVAVRITRRAEQLLRRERGFFSGALRDAGITEQAEREVGEQSAAAAGEGGASAARALAVGERAPTFEYTDLSGRAGRWEWPAATGTLRLAFFWGGLSLASIEEMSWIDRLSGRGRDIGLEALAVEASGMDAGATHEAMAKYRRYHPEPSFPVVADPGGRISGLFGAGEPLPQTFLLGEDGAVIHRSDSFDKAEAESIVRKVERYFALAGRALPPEREAGAGTSLAPAGGEEAPSIRAQREKEERFRSNLVQGDAYFMSWEFERALPHYLDALELQPNDLHTLIRTAQIHERRGQTARALALWERVLGVRPDHTEARARVEALRRSLPPGGGD